MNPEEALRLRNLAAAARLRWIFLALAIALPLALGTLFERQNNRLRALADHGELVTASVKQITRQGSATYTEYRYEVRGVTHEWSVTQRDAPYRPGESFPITYLPEDPSLSRPGAYSLARFNEQVDLSFQRWLLLGIFAFFAVGAAWCETVRRRLRASRPSGMGIKISPVTLGRVIATLLLLVTLGVNLDPKVAAVQAAAFGPAPWGAPIAVLVPLVQVVLYIPFFWVFPHLMRILMEGKAGAASFSKMGVLMTIARAEPALHRSRAIVIAGFLYFVALMAAWIAFANSRGV